jgi:thiol-disulfide isomerase/thioredoxin
VSAQRGDPAPPFDLPLVGGGYRGLTDIVEPGGGVLLFFKSSCATCKLILPRLGPLAAALEREKRLFLLVGQEEESAAKAFLAEQGIAGRAAWESAPYPTSVDYDIQSVPTLLVVDGAGVVAERHEGFVKQEYLDLGIALEQALALGDAPTVLDRPDDLPDFKPG